MAEPYSPEDIKERLPLGNAMEVIMSQSGDFKDGPATPTNSWGGTLPAVAVELLSTNTEIYEDDVEAYIDSDVVYKAYLEYKAEHAQSDELSIAIRARRTVLVRFLLECGEAADAGLGTAA